MLFINWITDLQVEPSGPIDKRQTKGADQLVNSITRLISFQPNLTMSDLHYDIFDPNCPNNVFVIFLSNEPMVIAGFLVSISLFSSSAHDLMSCLGCYVPASPERRTIKVKSFYNWLSYISWVETDAEWSLHSCTIKPGPDPFCVAIDSALRVPIDRDSTDHLAPGAYLILIDGQTLTCFSSYSKMTFRVLGTNVSPLVIRRDGDGAEFSLHPVGTLSCSAEPT
jgi:hypothetical protein